jgi:hypothetical protein
MAFYTPKIKIGNKTRPNSLNKVKDFFKNNDPTNLIVNNNNYNTLLILTDGQIHDMELTKE